MDESEKPKPSGIKAHIESSEPLSEEAIQAVLSHSEEDLLVDYKETFDPKSEKCWIDMAVDAVAFSNMHGGYLVFGVQDKTYKKTGLSEEICDALCDIKVVSEKISRNIRPNFRRVRSKRVVSDKLNLVVVYFPVSLDRTHIFEEDMNASLGGGQTKCIVRKGSIYIRKAGSNQIMTSDDFEELIARRVGRIREKIFEGVTKAINVGPEQEILVVTPEEYSGAEKTFKVVDAPDATAVKGLSLIAAPTSTEGKIALLQAAHKMNTKDLPHREALMDIYGTREILKLSPDQIEWLAEVSLIRETPAFYWLAKCGKKPKQIIKTAFGRASRIEKYRILKVAAFFGKPFYEELRDGQEGKGVRDARFPRRLEDAFNTGSLIDRASFEELQILAARIAGGAGEQELTEARKLDCGLYASFKERD